ncbi:hypothetical protein BDV97DRAFT_359752 [Delphinella strobiligena]|nr:hypothetical protein BDV97DRAFT_359752 [Delphinella strobiligena]
MRTYQRWLLKAVVHSTTIQVLTANCVDAYRPEHHLHACAATPRKIANIGKMLPPPRKSMYLWLPPQHPISYPSIVRGLLALCLSATQICYSTQVIVVPRKLQSSLCSECDTLHSADHDQPVLS